MLSNRCENELLALDAPASLRVRMLVEQDG